MDALIKKSTSRRAHPQVDRLKIKSKNGLVHKDELILVLKGTDS